MVKWKSNGSKRVNEQSALYIVFTIRISFSLFRGHGDKSVPTIASINLIMSRLCGGKRVCASVAKEISIRWRASWATASNYDSLYAFYRESTRITAIILQRTASFAFAFISLSLCELFFCVGTPFSAENQILSARTPTWKQLVILWLFWLKVAPNRLSCCSLRDSLLLFRIKIHYE